MEPFFLSQCLQAVRKDSPLIHCITNYVTVNDCANLLLGCGASPIMSDEVRDVEDIQTICNALVLNIGTLNERTIEAMKIAAARATELDHPMVLDPVGAGASSLRTEVAGMLVDTYRPTVIRGNMSEVKALAGAASSTRGVDVNPHDIVTEDNLLESAHFAKGLAASSGAILAITGAIDIVADAERAFAIFNGTRMMGRITGSGCMLTALTGAFCAANRNRLLEATISAVATMGSAGEIAQARMQPVDGNGSFRTYLLDAITNINGEGLEAIARMQEV